MRLVVEIYRGIRRSCQLSQSVCESVCSHCEEIAETQTIRFLEKIPISGMRSRPTFELPSRETQLARL